MAKRGRRAAARNGGGQPGRRTRLWLAGGAAIAVAGVIAVLFVFSQTGGGSGRSEPTTGAGSAATSGDRIVVYTGEEVLGGKEIDFASLLKQGKPVVLNFWAGACPPCRAEMPAFQRFYEERKGEFILIGVDVGPFTGLGSHNDARGLLRELRISYPTGYAVTSKLLRDFSVRSMPTTVFFDANGNEAGRHAGFMTEGQLRTQVGKLLDSP